MARQIREHDWARSALGPPEQWPEALKSALRLILPSAVPMAVAWGPELVHLCNEAALALIGDGGRTLLGRPLDSAWPQGWDIPEAHYRDALGGEPLVSRKIEVRRERDGAAEQAWIDASFSPIHDDRASVAGVLLVMTEVAGPVEAIQRAPAEAALRESEQQMRLIVESARDYAIFVTAPDNRIRTWLPGAQNVFGWSAEEAIGQNASITFTPEDRAADQPRKEIETAREEGKAPDVRWHQHKDGHRVFIEGQVIAMRDAAGEVQSFLKIGQDMTETRNAQELLRRSEERFRQFGEASSDLLWIRDAETLRFEYLSPAFERLYGTPREEVLAKGDVAGWLDLIHPEDRDRALEMLYDLRQGHLRNIEFRVIRPDGQIRWLHDTDFPVTDERGKVQRIAGIAQDVTERKRAVDMQATLLAELQHRVRNVLALMRSVVRRATTNKTDLEDFVQHLEGRIDAMARTQAVLTRAPGHGVDLEEMIRDELLAQAAPEEQVAISGPPVSLISKEAEVLTLAIHELATNSVKYGALQQDDARLDISWTIESRGERDWLQFDWAESGVAVADTDPPPGFGTELIVRRVPYELNGTSDFRLANDGLKARIEFPMDKASAIVESQPVENAEL